MTRLDQARVSLEGLSIGDAFGERYFVNPAVLDGLLAARSLPASPWKWTDDTAMAISVYQTLEACERIDPDVLAEKFASAYKAEPMRGYGGGAHRILSAINDGVPFHVAASSVFDGTGSYGNGGAMRSAPIGAYFFDDMDVVVANASLAAVPTHTHPEGVAGSIAIAVAAAEAQRQAEDGEHDPERLIATVVEHTPESETRDNVVKAQNLGLGKSTATAVSVLGNGRNISSQDTVGFCVYMAANYMTDFEEAMWATVSGLGDRDTTCAIVGGIIACYLGEEGLPIAWWHSRETLGM